MKTLNLLHLILLVALIGGCENPIIFKKEYTVSGTYYDADETTPVVGETLFLRGENFRNFQSYSEILAETTTDENGYFELTYVKNRKAGNLSIERANGKFILSSIPVNENYVRDVCAADVGYLNLTINVEKKLNQNDTIIFSLSNADSAFTSFKEGNKNYLVYPFKDKYLFNKISHKWGRSDNLGSVLRWGVGQKNYRQKAFEEIGPDGYPPNYKQYYIRGFPYQDTTSFTIK